MTTFAMNSRLKKEFRPLLLPWAGAVGCIALAAILGKGLGAGDLETIVFELAKAAFLGGLILLASLSFGTEVQQKTLPLLLSQPVDRSRIWAEKMLVLAAATGTAVLAGALLVVVLSPGGSSPVLGAGGNERVSPLLDLKEAMLAGVFLLAAICSCGFWTLFAGSSIGGFVFTIAAQILLGVAVAAPIAWIHGQEAAFDDSQTFPALVAAGVVYSAVFLWLGWRKFNSLEVRGASSYQASGIFDTTSWRMPWSHLLVAQPGQPVLNLVRKELRLEKPVVQLAAVFVVCWFSTCLLQWLRPKQNITYVFDVMTCIYAPLTSLLAGCVPLGEERVLGLTTSQLSLPFSPWRQWLVKLAVGLGTAAVLCLGLPAVCFLATSQLFDLSNGLMNPHDNAKLALGAFWGLTFLLAYWAISMVANAVRAALVAVGGLVAFGACVALGAWFGQLTNGWQTGRLSAIMCHLQITPYALQEKASHMAGIICWGMTLVIILLCLWQSLAEFQKTRQTPYRPFARALLLGTLVVALVFWSVDFSEAVNRLPESNPIQELRRGLNALAAQDAQNDNGREHLVPAQELEGSVLLSEVTRTWLSHASVSYRYTREWSAKKGETGHLYGAFVTFPNGEGFSFNGGYILDPRGRMHNL